MRVNDIMRRHASKNIEIVQNKYIPGDIKPKIYTDLITPITVAYDYIKADGEYYSFNHSEVSKNDINNYFSKMQKISKMTIKDLLSEGHYKRHFGFIENPSDTLINLLKHTFPEGLSPTPLIAQLALHTPKNGKPTDGTKSKAPRIYFIVNDKSILHILYLDLYHEIIPTKN